MSNPINPFDAPSVATDYAATPNLRVADLGKRFLGALVDGLLGMLVLPGYIALIVDAESNGGEPSLIGMVGLLWMLLSVLAVLIVQIYLLATRSQSVGKFVMKTQIVDYETGQPASFVHCFLLRSLVNGLIGAIPCVGAVYSIVDICFIFRDDRRCIHDLLASTIVVDIG